MMSYGYYFFDVLIRDVTTYEEDWIKDQCAGEDGLCKFAYDSFGNFNEITETYFQPKRVEWPYQRELQIYREEHICFPDFHWKLLSGPQGHRHLRLHDNDTFDPPLETAELIRRFLERWRPSDYFSLDYSVMSSNENDSPGAFYIGADRVRWLSVGEWLADQEDD